MGPGVHWPFVADEPLDAQENPVDITALLQTLRERVDARRAQGVYPPGLEADLDEHFRQLTGDRPPTASFVLDDLDKALEELEHFSFGRERISSESRIPGGTALHRTIAKSVGRQIQGVLEQAQDQSQKVAKALDLMAQVTGLLVDSFDKRMLQQLDDLQLRLAEHDRELNALIFRVGDVAARMPGLAVDTWYEPAAFTAHFRGAADEMHSRYADLAGRLEGCAPVLDIGFGRGEFLELLSDLGVDAWGIEIDQSLIDSALSRGLRAEMGTAFDYLRDLEDGSLGGLVMIQVIEHLSPQHVIDVVKLAAEKVRPGGRVIIETVNPTSLYTYAHAFWVDPDHVRPVHPTFLGFLFAAAGFAGVERVDRSPVPDGESLEPLPGDDELVKRINANFERINGLLFGPQDYAIVATR